MKINLLKKSTITAAVLAASLFAGCEAEHAKYVEPKRKEWEQTQQRFVYEVAQQLYKVGDYEKCREQLRPALAADTTYEPILVLAAKVEMEQGGSLETAKDELNHAIMIKPLDAEAYYMLGVVYQRWQQMDQAADYFQQASDKKPGDALYLLATVESLISIGKLDEAKQLLQDKLNQFEQSAAVRMALARIASLQGDREAAVTAYREATLLQPEDSKLRWLYAESLYDAGKFADASKVLVEMRKDEMPAPKIGDAAPKASEVKADAAAFAARKVNIIMTLGECYLSLNRPLDARDCFQEVIRMQPDNSGAYLSLGKACLVSNDYNLTLSAAKKVLRDDPSNLEGLILQAAAQQKLKHWGDALDTLTIAARVAPKNSTVLVMQGISELQLGKEDLAIEFLKKATVANPTDSWAQEILTQLKPVSLQKTEPVVPAAAPVPAPAVSGLPIVKNAPELIAEPAMAMPSAVFIAPESEHDSITSAAPAPAKDADAP